jgi:hypothetical protein
MKRASDHLCLTGWKALSTIALTIVPHRQRPQMEHMASLFHLSIVFLAKLPLFGSRIALIERCAVDVSAELSLGLPEVPGTQVDFQTTTGTVYKVRKEARKHVTHDIGMRWAAIRSRPLIKAAQ